MPLPRFEDPATRRMPALTALLTTMLLYGTPSAAAPIDIVNAGFEDLGGETPFNEFTFGALNGWDLYDPGNITSSGDGPLYFIGTLTPFETDPLANPGVYTNFPGGALQGQRVGIAFNFAASGGQGEYGFQQTLAATLAANTRYTLEVGIGNIASGTSMSGEFFDLTGFPGYRVDLIAGGELLAQDLNSAAGGIAEGAFGTATVEFTSAAAHAQLGQPLTIRLVNLNMVDPLHPASDLEVDFDDVRLSAVVVPVPPLLPVFSAFALSLFVRRASCVTMDSQGYVAPRPS